MIPSTLSRQLKTATKTNHQLLEQKIISVIKQISDVQDYGRLLQFFHGYFGGLELLVGKSIDRSFLADYSKRRKIELLADDLKHIQMPLLPFATNGSLPKINNHLQAMGTLYVMEGSTLGGAIIARMVRDRLGLIDDRGLQFFTGYGKDTMNMWQVFVAAIDGMVLNPGDKDLIVDAANDTFYHFSVWIEKNISA